MDQTRRALGVLALAALALLGAACDGAGNAATITLSEFQIKPKGVTLVAGRPATLTIVNSGKIDHNLEVDPALSDRPLLAVLKPGERTTVTYTPKAPGTFQYACSIPGHAPAGMTGAIAVEQ
jgi:uncharacterized cupredoxin-like copper-binding protein